MNETFVHWFLIEPQPQFQSLEVDFVHLVINRLRPVFTASEVIRGRGGLDRIASESYCISNLKFLN